MQPSKHRCKRCGARRERLAQNHVGEWVCTDACIFRDPTLTSQQRHYYERQLTALEARKRKRQQTRKEAGHAVTG